MFTLKNIKTSFAGFLDIFILYLYSIYNCIILSKSLTFYYLYIRYILYSKYYKDSSKVQNTIGF